MVPPKGFSQTVTKEAFIAAHHAAAVRTGVLRWRLPALLLAAALLCGAVVTVLQNPYALWYWVTAVVMAVVGAAPAILWLFVLPKRVKGTAAALYTTFDRLCNPAQVILEADEITLLSPCMTKRNSYARMKLCVETPERFVLVADDNTLIILENTCFADSAHTADFLRSVFARKYAKCR